MSEPEILALEEAIETVSGLVSWLKLSPEGTSLLYTPPADSGKEAVVCVRDARRAGRILYTLMHTAGIA